jgi:signal transduction histidine kinase
MRWRVGPKDSTSVNAPFLTLMHVLLQPLGYQDLAQAVVNALPRAFAADTAVLGALVLTLGPEAHSIEAFAFTEGPNQAVIARGLAGRPLQQLSGDYRRESNIIERVAVQRRAIGAAHLDEFLSGYLESPLLQRLEEIIGWRGGMAIPLAAQQRSAGVLLFALGKEIAALTDEERTRMTNVAHVVGLALEQARLYEEERRARRALEQAQEQGQTFLRIVAHDLKTPLTNILGYAQLAQRLRRRESAPVAGTPNDAGDRVHAACDKIVENCRRLQRLVDDLQEAFRLGSGRFEVQRKPVDLVALVRMVVEEQRAAAPDHTFTLSAPAQPLVGQWDGERVQQVVANLVSNAVKYSPSGGPITVAVQRRGAAALLSVSDKGVGIAKDDLPALFQPYSRRHQRLAIKGTGLGLYIVKGIAEAHGGRVRADSPGEGAGATFTVTLPLQPDG